MDLLEAGKHCRTISSQVFPQDCWGSFDQAITESMDAVRRSTEVFSLRALTSIPGGIYMLATVAAYNADSVSKEHLILNSLTGLG
jgi:hypothetical protein